MSAKSPTDVEVFKLIAQGVPRAEAIRRVQDQQAEPTAPAPFGNVAKGRRWTPLTA